MHEKRDDIQGLRAIAVIAVILYHAEHFLLPGGFVGVDLFFVVSGFLITGILLRPMEENRFSIIDFYRRRIKRLFPALFSMMAFTLLAGFLIFPPTLLVEQVESQFFTTLFVSNFYFADQTDYFDLQVELMPLLHTWSLGVEEQFYLLFPPVLYAIHRWLRAFLWPILAMVAILSLILSQSWLTSDADLAFYNPASRAFELLIGALCVGLEQKISLPATVARIVSMIALIALGTSFFIINSASAFPGVLALLPCLSTAALLLSRNGWANQLLSVQPLVRIGDMSYSLYLWHWPILVFTKLLYPNSPLAITIAVVLSFIVATASYRFIESPFLSSQPRKHMFPGAAAAMLVSIALCLAVYIPDGLPQRFSPEARAMLAASEDYNPDRKKCHMRSSEPRPYEETCIYGDKNAAPGFAVWGDSHGTELARVLGDRLTDSGQSLRSITMSGCPATLSRRKECTEHNIETLTSITADPSMHTILLSSNLHGNDTFAKETLSGVKQTALALKEAGKRVVIVYPLPTFDFDPPSKLALEVKAGRDPRKVGMARNLYEQRSGNIVKDFDDFTKSNEIYGISTAEIYCDAEMCYTYRDDMGVLYYNQGHISLTGASLLTDVVLAQLGE